ncbi:hypothetical protein [Arcobacter caeni]|uniref:Uncharacterized protein n=1 Tax=Arcobacter caeni TaxID=1912877 RepID=A0A363CXF0_9BACT|nr:hypothetical protein [Arcobacter caeni]PUE63780.1 hypothetical protein B0174_09545 [Arcobacter caeni]
MLILKRLRFNLTTINYNYSQSPIYRCFETSFDLFTDIIIYKKLQKSLLYINDEIIEYVISVLEGESLINI